MSHSYNPKNKVTSTVPNGGHANVTIAGTGASIPWTSGSGSTWISTSADSFYHKQPKVKITDSDIEIDGLSLRDTMQAIKDELLIPGRLNRNQELEQDFQALQDCADHYQALEQEFLEKKKMWETLKRQD